MDLFKLLGTIAINNSDANKAIDETGEKSEGLASKLKNVGSKASALGGKLTKGITVPAAAAGTAVIAFANKTAASADNVDKMSQRLGISREAYQELDFVLSQSGVDINSFQTGMKSLLANMDKVSEGNETAIANFEMLGVTVQNTDGSLKSQEEVLFETVSAFQAMEDSAEKSRLAQELFGKQGQEILPLLNSEAGSLEEMKQQAHDLGLVLSDEAINAGVDYTDKMDQLKRSFTATGAEVGEKMLPLLTKLGDFLIEKGIPAFEKVIDKVGKVVDWFSSLDSGTQKLIGVIAAVVVAAGPVISVIGTIISIGGTLAGVIGAISAPVLGVVAAIAAVIAIGVLLYKNWDNIKEAAGNLKEAISEKWNNIKEKTSEAFGKVKESMSNAMDKAKSYVSGKLDSIKQKYEENGGGIKGIAAATMEGYKQFYKTGFDAVNKLTGGKLGDMVDKVKEKMDAAKEKVKDAIDNIKEKFNFKWEFPKLKLPHFSFTGSFSLNPLSVPKLSVDWYKKAMNSPMLMTKPTAFGINSFGQIMAGGEAGAEVVSGANTLMDMISDAVDSRNGSIVEAINRLIDFLQAYIPGMANMQIVMDSGTVVGELAPQMDIALGKLAFKNGRGF